MKFNAPKAPPTLSSTCSCSRTNGTLSALRTARLCSAQSAQRLHDAETLRVKFSSPLLASESIIRGARARRTMPVFAFDAFCFGRLLAAAGDAANPTPPPTPPLRQPLLTARIQTRSESASAAVSES
jgi:hypothetical protein